MACDSVKTPKATVPGNEPERLRDKTAGKPVLRFLTCGSVDDGKSTLIARLLLDSQLVMEDHLQALELESKHAGKGAQDVDLALLMDGLQAEREQGITIDVAYRYFATKNRKFIVADTPGHEQYTRNMATGASQCDLAVVLVDARKGILVQTRRHSHIIDLLGIKHVVLAINKMDLVDYAEDVFAKILSDFERFAAHLNFESLTAMPLVAAKGDNITTRSGNMPWFNGEPLLSFLEKVDIATASDTHGFRFPVQWVNRPNLDFRGYCGSVSEGSVSVGDEIVVLPSARTTRVNSIVTYDGALERAGRGAAITLVLEDELDISRGDIIAGGKDRPSVADQVCAQLIWMGEEPLIPGRRYVINCANQTTGASVTKIKHRINVNTQDHSAAKRLHQNDIGVVNLAFDRPLAFEPYARSRTMGSFILIDRMSNATIAAGMIQFGLRRADNIHWQAIEIDKQARSALKNQKPLCLWFTGLSGSGKSTIANLLEKKLHAQGLHTYIMDGDNVRHGLNRDLGFTEADRVENIRRVAEVSKMMVDAGLIVLVSFISPFVSERQMARDLFDDDEFFEVFVDTPLEICEQRDVKGLYAKARAGKLRNFTGIDSPYESPEDPEFHLKAGTVSAEALVDEIVLALERKILSR